MVQCIYKTINHATRRHNMGKKIFKITSKANNELRWYDDSRECQFIVYSPYFVYSFIDKQDAVESGCNLSNLEFRNIDFNKIL